eukprot:UN17832
MFLIVETCWKSSSLFVLFVFSWRFFVVYLIVFICRKRLLLFNFFTNRRKNPLPLLLLLFLIVLMSFLNYSMFSLFSHASP